MFLDQKEKYLIAPESRCLKNIVDGLRILLRNQKEKHISLQLYTINQDIKNTQIISSIPVIHVFLDRKYMKKV